MKRILALAGLFLSVACTGVAGPGGNQPQLSYAIRVEPGRQGQLEDGLKNPYPAPEFADIKDWINSKPLSLRSLRGKVVLIDFWTYSCINCVRTLPHITAWDRKYRSQGLVIIGVHTPEFKFEKDIANIKTALAKDHIRYPVAVDSSEATWNAYKNESWPAHYLIDKSGAVVYTHFGEGDYDVTENNIRTLLGMDHEDFAAPEALPFSDNQTPETYLGSERAERKVTQLNSALPLDHWGLAGRWKIEGERIKSSSPGAVLRLHFNAKKVFLVMGASTGHPVDVALKLNGRVALGEAGKDAHGGVVTVKDHALYELVNQDSVKPGLLEITTSGAGVEMYAFTFGS
jgi:thiol-disulfide isomerase/thioredoxin